MYTFSLSTIFFHKSHKSESNTLPNALSIFVLSLDISVYRRGMEL